MRSLAVFLCVSAAVYADGLTIGDKAPPIEITHWIKGAPVKEFEPGHAYVIEFWATW